MAGLIDLYAQAGQSPWLDNLRRDWTRDGTLQGWIDRGIRGVTSNPTIFAKGIQASNAYDEQLLATPASTSTEEAYWELAAVDIQEACDLLLPIHQSSDGEDGFVSLEVSPYLARETQATVKAGLELVERIQRPNLMVKVPATIEGLEAIAELTAAGVCVNVTLIFSIDRYVAVMDAYLEGLRRRRAQGGDLSSIRSVASFFVSRIDSAVDARLEDVDHGRSAVAQARRAAQVHAERFASPLALELLSSGGRVQRPLWASTSTKNPLFPDLLYVDSLVGPGSVNTLPDATALAFDDHGDCSPRIGDELEASLAWLDGLVDKGIDLEVITETLEAEGLLSFQASFDELLAALEAKRNAG
ncbi:MAG: transaldolase [Actinobacteria bacterium]|nr:transaldolase [Actinomycetota bacterium]